ncbi:MAG TPA: cytochrome c [Thermoflexales bacterium]|nr:cytochrome c [Thermoflexales bacterium]HQX74867.1 cytochrome c [Thermoflexales bacterium]HQZ20930.1 cytochrome c [Thermoflexales bacterium]HRA00262.1 cytochrome c [Thermoflexales bacterium]
MKTVFWVMTAAMIVLCACGAGAPAPTPTAPPAATLSPAQARGKELFGGKGRCATCHALEPGKVIVGPSLAGVGDWAAHRRANQTAADYIEESILSPDAYKAPGFEAAQMDVSLAKTLTNEEVNDIVQYLLAQK